MTTDDFHVYQLAAQGFCCSQILLILGLEAQGKENSEMIRAMHGLCGGMGKSGGTCGVLTGGTCLIGLYAGKGAAKEQPHPAITIMVQDLLDWFDETYRCRECQGLIQYKLEKDSEYPVECMQIIRSTYDKVQEILSIYMKKAEEEEF